MFQELPHASSRAEEACLSVSLRKNHTEQMDIIWIDTRIGGEKKYTLIVPAEDRG